MAAGVLLYNGALKAVPLRKMLLWAMLLGTGLGATQLLLVSGANRSLGLDDQLFVLGDSVILTVLGQARARPAAAPRSAAQPPSPAGRAARRSRHRLLAAAALG